MTAEIELKLAIDPVAVAATIRKLARHPALATVKSGRWRTAKVVSTYLDTPDWQLSRAGVALRLRRDGVRWLQTVKGPPLPGAGGALHARPEYEWPVPGPTLDPARLATTPWRRLLGGAIADGKLAPRFTTDFERRTLALRFADGTRATLCVDVGEIRVAAAGRRGDKLPRARVPIAEIEIELGEGKAAADPAALFALAQTLAADLPLTVAVANKAARGVALVRGRPDGFDAPVRAGTAVIAPGATAADALRAIALECLQQIAGNAAGLAADTHVEWVHQMRIGTRRLRACLALATRVAPAGTLAPLVAETRWLAGVLGAARDLDVFATETLPRFVACSHAAPPARPVLARLRNRVTARRRLARAAAREAVAGPRFLQLVLGIGAWAAAPEWSPAPGGDAAAGAKHRDRAAAPATTFARRVIARRHRRLVRLAGPGLAGNAEERHALRIAAKKLRYATEFFVPLFPARHAAAYVGALSGLQDVLGRANDAATAMRLATELAGDDDALAAGVRGWAAAEATGMDVPLAAAWKRLAKAGRFWKRH